MSSHQMILENSFWKFLVSLEELKEKKEIVLFCSSLSIEEETLQSYCEFLKKFEITVSIDESFIFPLKDHCRIKVEFSLSEWLSLEALLHEQSTKDTAVYYNQIMSTKFKTVQRLNKHTSLFADQPSGLSFGGRFNQFESFKKRVDFLICNRKLMKIIFVNSNVCELLPHRLVFLDGILCVVGENLKDKTLCYFAIEDVAEIEELYQQYEPNLSQIEVNEFICHLRMVNGKEERLVLKIYSQEEADLLPAHHFLGNPFITSNSEGDMIWAASLEMCDDVYHWLWQMRDRVEILDPGHIRKEFANYCELKNLVSDKKAS